MGNWIKAYGWSGHILTSKELHSSDPDHNLIAIDDHAFCRLFKDYDNSTLPEPIEARKLGIEDGEDMFLAVGTGFYVAFDVFGTPFIEAEMRTVIERDDVLSDNEYITAMKTNYGIELPECRLMIGCSKENEE